MLASQSESAIALRRQALAAVRYHEDHGLDLASEALPGVLSRIGSRKTPSPLQLHAEQLTEAAFGTSADDTSQSWLFRLRPSLARDQFRPSFHPGLLTSPLYGHPGPAAGLCWAQWPRSTDEADFIDGLMTIAANGAAGLRSGAAVHAYAASRSMEGRVFFNADGEFLIIPQSGGLRIVSEFGVIEVGPGSIAVMPRYVRFRVELPCGPASGLVCENYGAAFQPPCNPDGAGTNTGEGEGRLVPMARFEDILGPSEIVQKFMGAIWTCETKHSALDVVAWCGDIFPYMYRAPAGEASAASDPLRRPSPSIVLASHAESSGDPDLEVAVSSARPGGAGGQPQPAARKSNGLRTFLSVTRPASGERASPAGAAAAPEHVSALACDAGACRLLLPPSPQAGAGREISVVLTSRWAWRPTRAAMAGSLEPGLPGRSGEGLRASRI